MRTMIDSTSAADALAQPADLYGGYSDGIYADLGALRAGAPPGAIIVEFSAVGTDSGTVCDIEPGCVWPPAKAVPWVAMRRAAGIDPSCYVSRSNWPSAIAVFDAAGVPQPHWVVAHYTNTAHLCDGACFPSSVGGLTADATQYGGDLAGHYDISCVADYWPGVDSADTTASSAATLLETDVTPEEHEWLRRLATVNDAQANIDAPGWLTPTQQIVGLIQGGDPQTGIQPALISLLTSAAAADFGQTALRSQVASIYSLLADPAGGALVRVAQLQAAFVALPAGTTADSPAAAQALADLHTLAAEFTSLGTKLGAA